MARPASECPSRAWSGALMRSLMSRLAVRIAMVASAVVLAGGMVVANSSADGVAAAATTLTAAEVALPANAGTNPSVSLSSVSCGSAGNCTAVGY